MPQKIELTEWAQVESYFSKKPFSDQYVTKLTRQSSPHHTASEPQTKYSYVRFGKDIYQVFPGEKKPGGEIAGTGASARVKYLYDKKGIRYTVKIDKDKFAGPRAIGAEHEDTISLDMGFFRVVGYREKPVSISKKRGVIKSYRYAVMADHGSELYAFLKEKAYLSDEERLNIAFQACFQVYQLHEGHLSQSGKPVAHLDIKSKNFFYNQETQKLTLGDYGFAEYGNLDKTLIQMKGTPNNLPFTKNHAVEIKHWSKRDLDIFALKRTCHCPIERNTAMGFFNDRASAAPSILSNVVLDKYKLRHFFDTTVNQKPKQGPLFLGAICLLAKMNEHALIPEIVDSKNCQAAITVLHFAGLLDSAQINLVLCEPSYAKVLSTYVKQAETLSAHDIAVINKTFQKFTEPKQVVSEKIPSVQAASNAETEGDENGAKAYDPLTLKYTLPKDPPLAYKYETASTGLDATYRHDETDSDSFSYVEINEDDIPTDLKASK